MVAPEERAPADHVQALIDGILRAYAARAFAELRIADHLREGPLPLAALAERVNADPDALRRFLRCAEALGLCARTADGGYEITPAGAVAASDGEAPLRPWMLLLTSPTLTRAWEQLAGAVRAGRSLYEEIQGAPFFEHLAARPDEAAVFNAAMTSGGAARSRALHAAIDWSDAKTLVDIGGGHGLLAAGVLALVPGLRAIVADLPEVLSSRPSDLLEDEVRARMGFQPCDFFSAVPREGDVYVLSRILHDWDDRDCARILGTCRAAMRPGARLCVIEQIVPDDGDAPRDRQLWTALRDLNMLVLLGGKERTAAEYGELLAGAGFIDVRVRETEGIDVITASAA